jgi:transposase
MVLEGERTVASVAREFDINASTLGSRVTRYRVVHAQEESLPVSGPERARIRELERENAEFREKPAFLKKRPPSSRRIAIWVLWRRTPRCTRFGR